MTNTKIFRQFTVDKETGNKSEVFVNPDHITAFRLEEDGNIVAVDFANGTSVFLDGDFFSVLATNALDIVPVMSQEEQALMMESQSDVNKTEYIDETPLEEPGAVENVEYVGQEDAHPELEPEQHAGEDDEYEPETNAVVEGASA